MKIIPPMGTPDEDGVITHSLNSNGHEVVDNTPMAPPVGYKHVPSMVDIIRAQIRAEKLRLEAEEAGLETFDEADDFEVGDDYDPTSPYEEQFEPVAVPPSAATTGAAAAPAAGEAAPAAAATPPAPTP